MRKIQFQTLTIAILSLFLSACFLPTSSTTVSGRVTEYARTPVSGAEVSFGGTGFETTTTTDAGGKFTVRARNRPTQMLCPEIKKVGFATDEKVESSVNDKKVSKDIKKTTDESSNDGKIPKTISGGDLNGKAVDLPKSAYPAAAREAKFKPTILRGTTVKVTRMLVYNFVP